MVILDKCNTCILFLLLLPFRFLQKRKILSTTKKQTNEKKESKVPSWLREEEGKLPVEFSDKLAAGAFSILDPEEVFIRLFRSPVTKSYANLLLLAFLLEAGEGTTVVFVTIFFSTISAFTIWFLAEGEATVLTSSTMNIGALSSSMMTGLPISESSSSSREITWISSLTMELDFVCCSKKELICCW